MKDNEDVSAPSIVDLRARGQFWEILGFSSNDFTALELAKQYSTQTKTYQYSPEGKRVIDDAFATLNAPLTRQLYEYCRGVMQAIRSEVGERRYHQAERAIWDELWGWVSHKWQKPPEELIDSLKVKHAKSKIVDGAKKAAYEAWEVENQLDMSLCWFCAKQISTEDNNLIIGMHQVLSNIGNEVAYQQIHLTIPRCAACCSEHSFDRRFAVAFAAIVVISGVAGFGATTGEWWVLAIPWVWAVLAGIGYMGYLMGLGIAKILKRGNSSKSEDHYKSCPIYRVARNQGYVDGDKPSST